MKKILIASMILLSISMNAQELTNKAGSSYKFTLVKEIPGSDVKNQGRTSTCWSFSALSFLESEIERNGKGKVNLSEMYIVRMAYTYKAERYLRMMGKVNFGEGGAFHDVVGVIGKAGLMPQEVYPGQPYGGKEYNHSEMESALLGYLDNALKLKEGKLHPGWRKVVNGILDSYLGELPERFNVNGKMMNPLEYAAFLGIKADDYVELSSFTHHPFYTSFMLEVPDNWAGEMVYNVPLNEFEQTMKYALENNYSVAWASDVSEPGFSHKNGLAILPEVNLAYVSKEERIPYFMEPQKQMLVTQEKRQEEFDALQTQDDHGMHITGIVKDQLDNHYYIVKNSWGADSNELGGYFYCSSAYFNLKTTCILLPKKAIPPAVRTKLKL